MGAPKLDSGTFATQLEFQLCPELVFYVSKDSCPGQKKPRLGDYWQLEVSRLAGLCKKAALPEPAATDRWGPGESHLCDFH